MASAPRAVRMSGRKGQTRPGRTIMKRNRVELSSRKVTRLRLLRATLVVFTPLCCLAPVQAAVTPVGYWRLGEFDPGAYPADPCRSITADATGQFPMLRQGSLAQNNAFYSADVPT